MTAHDPRADDAKALRAKEVITIGLKPSFHKAGACDGKTCAVSKDERVAPLAIRDGAKAFLRGKDFARILRKDLNASGRWKFGTIKATPTALSVTVESTAPGTRGDLRTHITTVLRIGGSNGSYYARRLFGVGPTSVMIIKPKGVRVSFMSARTSS